MISLLHQGSERSLEGILADANAVHAEGEAQELLLKVPTNFSELRAVRHTLALYQRACPGQIAVLLLTFYLFLQARQAIQLGNCIAVSR
jgi:hypothetical protein